MDSSKKTRDTFPAEPQSSATLLVVDDEDLNRQLFEAQLLPEGYDVVLAADGAEALDLLERRQPDLVLLDVLMPGMNGFQTCRAMRRILGKKYLPIVFVTALTDRDSRILGLDAGGDDFLTKPVDETELVVRVRNLLRVKAYHDILARHRELLEEELDRTRGQLLHADRLATLGTLAAGVGHELNNIASVLKASLFMIREDLESGLAPQEDDLENLEACLRHVTNHARQMQRLGRPSSGDAEVVDLGAVASDVLEMLRLTGRIKYVEVERAFPGEPVLVAAPRTGLEQVLINLVANAADAVADNADVPGRIVLEVSADASVERAVCRVSDNGNGIPEERLATVFEPYFTTKPEGRGTGLGLVVVKSIVESCSGTISLASREGEGAAFTVELPLHVGERGGPSATLGGGEGAGAS